MYRLAQQASLNIGNIDWDDYFLTMYARFQRIFKLPVYYKEMGYFEKSKITGVQVALWIVSTMVKKQLQFYDTT